MGLFQIGDSVEVLDEKLSGEVVAVTNSEITIESEDGFMMKYAPNELVKISESNAIRVTNFEVAQIKAEKENTKRKNKLIVKPKERNVPKMEVDLHINQLVKSPKGMSNHENLNLQMETAKRQLEFAMRKRIQKVVFIHGSHFLICFFYFSGLSNFHLSYLLTTSCSIFALTISLLVNI
jgi:hypothetical protein